MQENSNKKIIVMVSIIILVIVMGILIYILAIVDNKTDDSKNPNVNDSVFNDDEKTNNDKDNRSVVLANVKFLTSDYLEKEKGTKYYIYKDKTQKGDDEYYIIPEKDKKHYDENYQFVDSYTCQDKCITNEVFFLHEDKSLEYFDRKVGKVKKLTLAKKYETISEELVVLKYSDGKNIFYYGEYKGDRAFSPVGEDGAIELTFEYSNLLFGSSTSILDKGMYILALGGGTELSYEIYSDTKNRVGYGKYGNTEFYDVSLELSGENYKINVLAAGGEEHHLILSPQLKEIVSFSGNRENCLLKTSEYYCYFNDAYNLEGKETSAKIVKYDNVGKETLLKQYVSVVDMTDGLVVMALGKDKKYEIYDLAKNKVLYTFDALTSSQGQSYNTNFEIFNYFDKKTNTFHAFVKDAKLTKNDFPNENHNPEKDNYVNMFGYEYTYNVKTGEGKVTKKATYSELE